MAARKALISHFLNFNCPFIGSEIVSYCLFTSVLFAVMGIASSMGH